MGCLRFPYDVPGNMSGNRGKCCQTGFDPLCLLYTLALSADQIQCTCRWRKNSYSRSAALYLFVLEMYHRLYPQAIYSAWSERQ